MDHVEEDSPRIQRSRVAVEVVAVTFVGEARDVCGGAELRGGDAQVREFVQPQARRLQVDAEQGCTGQIPARDGDDRRHGDRGLDEQGARRDRERVDGAVRSRGLQGSAPGRNRLGRCPGLVDGDGNSGSCDGRRGRAARRGGSRSYDGRRGRAARRGGSRLAHDVREPLRTLVEAVLEPLTATGLRWRHHALARKALAGTPAQSAGSRLRFGGREGQR